MIDWRDYILQHFREPVHRLTLVADPDNLMREEGVLAAIRRHGFDLLPFADHVAFRYAYESTYRQHWDDGQDTDLVVILHAPRASLQALPYDLLQSGRALAFGLPDLFPKLSYPVIRDLDRAHFQQLYEAYQAYDGPTLGDQATQAFVLRHVFGLVPDLVRTPTDLLRLLLSRHARGEVVPPALDERLLAGLRANPAFAGWPLESLLGSADEFLAFLQARWPAHLARQQTPAILREAPGDYVTTPALPFDDLDVRAYVDTFFLDGRLRPVPLPAEWRVAGWAQVGVEQDTPAARQARLARLTQRLGAALPPPAASYRDWTRFAAAWAELAVLRYGFTEGLDESLAQTIRALHRQVEDRFASWMAERYHTLHNLPYLPAPVMVHHIPHYLAVQRQRAPRLRQALVVLDGLALDQWRIVRDGWAAEAVPWTWEEGQTFAWVPTLTSISRQALFAGVAPQFFPDSWSRTDQDAARWQRFWSERGLHPQQVGYLRNLGLKHLDLAGEGAIGEPQTVEPEVLDLLADERVQVVGLVVNTVDAIAHGMQLGPAGMHQQVRLWLTRTRYLTNLIARLLEASFAVYLTSDHGNVWARGIGRPREGVLAETRGERARVYTDPAFLALGKGQSPAAIAWPNVGLPPGLQVLLAPHLDAFLDAGAEAICHGGIALEEVIVSFVQLRGAS